MGNRKSGGRAAHQRRRSHARIWARATPVLIACAWAVSTSACAVMTSELRRGAGLVLVLRDVERALVLADRVDQQIVEGIGLAQLEIGGREGRLQGESRIGEIGGARLRAGDLALDRAADPAPEIDRPAPADQRTDSGRRAGRARDRGIVAEGRKQLGARLGDQRFGLTEIGLVGLQRLVGDLDLGLQAVEQRIVEELPPVALGEIVARAAELPALDLLVLGGNDRRRPHDSPVRPCNRRGQRAGQSQPSRPSGTPDQPTPATRSPDCPR